jgi:hypothetical protein
MRLRLVLTVCAVFALSSFDVAQRNPDRRVAFTLDDLPTASVLGDDLAQARKTTAGLLSALRRQQIPAIGFVNERKLGAAGKPHPERVALLQQWIDAGLELGNHTFSHVDLHRVNPAYTSRDEYYGPAGITWLHRWALTEGKRGIFAGEPVVPEWIEKAAQGI